MYYNYLHSCFIFTLEIKLVTRFIFTLEIKLVTRLLIIKRPICIITNYIIFILIMFSLLYMTMQASLSVDFGSSIKATFEYTNYVLHACITLSHNDAIDRGT